jgi:hypothetical protein
MLFGALTNDRSVGRSLEQLLCLAGLYFVLRAPRLTAGRAGRGTPKSNARILFLSGLERGRVFASKFLSSALIAFTNLLAIFPMLALPFLTAGFRMTFPRHHLRVAGPDVVRAGGFAAGFGADARRWPAIVLANVLGVLLCALMPADLPGTDSFFAPRQAFSMVVVLKPGLRPVPVWRGFGSGFHLAEQAEFWQNLTMTLGWSALALFSAASP